MDLAAYRDYVRLYLDLEVEDLSDNLIDRWVDEAQTRAIRFQRRWPFLEVSQDIATLPDVDTYETTMRTVFAVTGGPDGSLTRLSETAAEDDFFYGEGVARTGRPYAWSEWGYTDTGVGIRLWPKPDNVWPLKVRGYKSVAPMGNEAGSVPGLPLDFHNVLLSWVMYRAYLQQDDTELAEVQKQSFDEGLATLATDEMTSPPDEPLVWGGGARNAHRRRPFGDPLGPQLGGGWGQ